MTRGVGGVKRRGSQPCWGGRGGVPEEAPPGSPLPRHPAALSVTEIAFWASPPSPKGEQVRKRDYSWDMSIGMRIERELLVFAQSICFLSVLVVCLKSCPEECQVLEGGRLRCSGIACLPSYYLCAWEMQKSNEESLVSNESVWCTRNGWIMLLA